MKGTKKMKKFIKKQNHIIGMFALMIVSMIAFSCNKESATENSSSSQLTMENVRIGELHNVFCKEILNRQKEEKSVIVSTEAVLEWMDICAETAENMNLGTHDDIQESTGLAKGFFMAFGNDENGENLLFSEKVFIEDEIEGLLEQAGCPEDVKMVIMEMYNGCVEGAMKKPADDYLALMETLPSSIHKTVFIDIYKHSRMFWREEGNSKESGNPPGGMSCEDWSYVMDAIGGTIGIGLGGGLLSWFVSTAVGTAFSVAAANDCEEPAAAK